MKKKAWTIILTLGFATSLHAQRHQDDKNSFNPNLIYQTETKHPSNVYLLKGDNNRDWNCRIVRLRKHCSDLDGCQIKLTITHKIDPNDKTWGVTEFLTFEQKSVSQNKKPSINGHTRQSGGGQHAWISGGKHRATLFAPFGLVFLKNYKPAHCPGQKGLGDVFKNPYMFTLVSHPHVTTVAVVQD